MNSLLSIVFIAIGLAMDAFAVSIVSSIIIGKIDKRQVFRLSFHFGLFQALMPLIGWFIGKSLQSAVSGWGNIIAFFILLVIGLKAVIGGLNPDEEEEQQEKDPSKGLSLIALAVATSIDALAVGVTFGVMKTGIILPVIIIGVITALMSVVGIYIGKRVGKMFGSKMEIIGGLVLIAIGIKILLVG